MKDNKLRTLFVYTKVLLYNATVVSPFEYSEAIGSGLIFNMFESLDASLYLTSFLA